MLIGIDGNEANVNKKVGISEYAFKLISYFSKLQNSNTKYQIYLKSRPLPDLPQPSEGFNYRLLMPGKLWTQWRLPLDLYIHRPRPEVFFSLTHYAPRFSPIPTIVSIMDLSYLYFPEMFNKSDLFQLKNWTAYSVKNATKVITISNSSRSDIIKEYKVPENRIEVIYPGIKTNKPGKPMLNFQEIKTKYDLKNDYILFVGTLQPRKNIIRLIEAFEILVKKNSNLPDLQLVIVGKKGWLYDQILQKPSQLGIEDRIKFLNYVSDEQLSVLYQHAICFVLPSLYEGFGLPVLEAMRHNCPVITSNISSLPEAGGDAALYVDPLSSEDIAQKMHSLVSDSKLRHDMIEKGKKQILKFNWENTAKNALTAIEDTIKASKR